MSRKNRNQKIGKAIETMTVRCEYLKVMLKKIYQELVTIRKELQAIRDSLKSFEKNSLIIQTTLTRQKAEIKGITIDLPTHDIQQEAKENK